METEREYITRIENCADIIYWLVEMAIIVIWAKLSLHRADVSLSLFYFSLFFQLSTVSDEIIHNYFQVKLNTKKERPTLRTQHIPTANRPKTFDSHQLQIHLYYFMLPLEPFIYTHWTLSNMFPFIFHTRFFLDSRGTLHIPSSASIKLP